jgi:hypothetical protein
LETKEKPIQSEFLVIMDRPVNQDSEEHKEYLESLDYLVWKNRKESLGYPE